jgi:hypothetical protein
MQVIKRVIAGTLLLCGSRLFMRELRRQALGRGRHPSVEVRFDPDWIVRLDRPLLLMS